MTVFLNNSDGTNLKEKISSLTALDSSTSWDNIIYIEDKASSNIIKIFEGNCLRNYPRSAKDVCDNGTEFTDWLFKRLIETYGIDPKPITLKNLRTNSKVEKIHLTMVDILRTASFAGTCWK